MSMFLFIVHYGDNKFPVSKKIIARLERRISALLLGYENGLVYPVHISDEKCE